MVETGVLRDRQRVCSEHTAGLHSPQLGFVPASLKEGRGSATRSPVTSVFGWGMGSLDPLTEQKKRTQSGV